MNFKSLLAGLLGIEALLMLAGLASRIWSRKPGSHLEPPTEILYLMALTLVACSLAIVVFWIYEFLKRKKDR